MIDKDPRDEIKINPEWIGYIEIGAGFPRSDKASKIGRGWIIMLLLALLLGSSILLSSCKTLTPKKTTDGVTLWQLGQQERNDLIDRAMLKQAEAYGYMKGYDTGALCGSQLGYDSCIELYERMD